MNRFDYFISDERASMTVEFVVILPLLIFWFIGTIVFFDAYKSRMRADSAAYTIADIISRHEDTPDRFGLFPSDVAELELLKTAMLPRDPGGWLRFSSIRYDVDDANGDGHLYEVLWSEPPNADLDEPRLLTANIPVEDLPLMRDEEVVLFVESTVPYVPMADWIGISPRDWVTNVAISPRFETEILLATGQW